MYIVFILLILDSFRVALNDVVHAEFRETLTDVSKSAFEGTYVARETCSVEKRS